MHFGSLFFRQNAFHGQVISFAKHTIFDYHQQ